MNLFNMISQNELLAIVLFIIPYAVMLACIIVTLYKYFKANGINTSSIFTAINALSKDKYLKGIIDTGISIVASADFVVEDQLPDMVVAVKRYLNTYLYEIMQLSDSVIITNPEDDDIYDILKENNVKVDAISDVTNGILKIMGYDDKTITNLIIEKIKNDK